MSGVVGLVVIVVMALVQVAIMPAFNIFGAHPNLLIVALVLWITFGSQREALLLVAAAGFVHSLLDAEHLGVTMLALSPLILLSEVRKQRLLQPDLLLAVTLTALATLAYEGILLLTLPLTGDSLGWLSSVLDVLVPAIIANVLLLLPAYGLVRLVSPRLQPRRAF